MVEDNSENLAFEIFPWNRNFETGIDSIDQQHRTLVEILNRLARHSAASTSEQVCSQVLDELLDYAAFHFEEEERIWRQVFPGCRQLQDHLDSHQLFFARIREFQSSEASQEDILTSLFKYLTRWLAFHILDSDRKMALTAQAVEGGSTLEQAKAFTDNSASILVAGLLDIYGKLSALAIQFIREKSARLRAEEELTRVQQQHIRQALEEQASDYQQQLEFLAYYDPVTGLLNRNGIIRELKKTLALEHPAKGEAALISLDLDNFYDVNARVGEEAADRYLGLLGRRWLDALYPGGALARVSGDEFVVLVQDSEQVHAQLEAMRLTAWQPCDLGGGAVTASFTAGVVLFLHDSANDADTLLRQADQTLFRAKQEARGSWLFLEAGEQRQYRSRQKRLEELQFALHNDQFRLYYQPKVDLCSGELIGLEALIRWQHPQLGLLQPGAFLPAIEHHLIIVDIGEWVIEAALQQMRRWDEQGLRVNVSVNIAALQLLHPAFVSRLQAILARFPDIAAQRLDIEILETATLGDLDKATEVILQCAALGVSFSLDDFGTGYSSLSYLKQLPVQTLKIDQGFVLDSLQNTGNISILRAIIGLSRVFNHNLIAEGVETVRHGEVLIGLGCTVAQGYAIAEPMPAARFAEWQRSWKPHERWRAAGLKC
ncbi:putative bifunctional diguanylate cyclase/phosphodiesterase [Pseudomonas borbori]|uniref:Diguanylate cyclase (GGDEF) domain-containing protein/hemerythrin-like metal-binding domain protein n=1 Tax=Pseudomonas borbori TaxID=289003 RepID=A0A1I5V617_9PSED|nr:bacteriohemerythrin [Pseudomonas borbori]SFQ02945.1 diguanylate cyclase (GGDEF) domain-containing protein/hemerythrin-like metal-binding domain protein [Pseudomonas borbori]